MLAPSARAQKSDEQVGLGPAWARHSFGLIILAAGLRLSLLGPGRRFGIAGRILGGGAPLPGRLGGLLLGCRRVCCDRSIGH